MAARKTTKQLEIEKVWIAWDSDKRKVIDVTEDQSGADLIASALGDNIVEIHEVDAIVVRRKEGRGRSAKEVCEVYVLDRNCEQGRDFAASEHATLAVARRSALEKLTPIERQALGLPVDGDDGGAWSSLEAQADRADGADDTEPAKPAKPTREHIRKPAATGPAGSAVNPRRAADDDDPFADDDD